MVRRLIFAIVAALAVLVVVAAGAAYWFFGRDGFRLALEDVELAADIGPLLAGRIENADVLVSDSRIDMPVPLGLPQPNQRDAATSDVASDAPVRIVSIRSITLR